MKDTVFLWFGAACYVVVAAYVHFYQTEGADGKQSAPGGGVAPSANDPWSVAERRFQADIDAAFGPQAPTNI